MYYGYRYYDPVSLTWTQADPLYRFVPDMAWDEPRRANLYVFTLQNPVRMVDPDGHDAIKLVSLPGEPGYEEQFGQLVVYVPPKPAAEFGLIATATVLGGPQAGIAAALAVGAEDEGDAAAIIVGGAVADGIFGKIKSGIKARKPTTTRRPPKASAAKRRGNGGKPRVNKGFGDGLWGRSSKIQS